MARGAPIVAACSPYRRRSCSGNASAPELLPGFWSVTGQLLPPGAGGQPDRATAVPA